MQLRFLAVLLTAVASGALAILAPNPAIERAAIVLYAISMGVTLFWLFKGWGHDYSSLEDEAMEPEHTRQ